MKHIILVGLANVFLLVSAYAQAGGEPCGDVALSVDIAMDGNRDGTVSFSDPADTNCLFWVNDDYDVAYLEDEMWQEDDKPNGESSQNRQDDTIGATDYGLARRAGSLNSCRRDLEDFTRLHIRINDEMARDSSVSCWLVFENGSPSVNLFEAVDKSLDYLRLGAVADEQIGKTRLLTVGGTEVKLPRAYIKMNGKTSPFILEGKTEGKGNLTLIVKKNGNVIGRKSISLELRPITRFYKVFRVASAGEDSVDASDSQYNSDFASSDDYLLFVHGFNMDADAKKYWPETVFKRLWWQGYKGQLGIFDWPCEMGSLNVHCYDNSEYNAWRCGGALLNRIAQLNSAGHAGLVRILAHSQGNIVSGEALRNATGVIAQAYIASQAASASDLYCAGLEQNPNKYKASFPTTPKVLDCYPESGMPYLKSISQHVESGRMYNYFNSQDWALRMWEYSWEVNNAWKPDDPNYSYHEEDGDIDTIQTWPPEYFFCSAWGFRVLSFPQDRFEIFSYAAEARSYPLGVRAISAFNSFDLKNSSLHYTDAHYSHSRQFLSNIVDEWPYWGKAITDCMFTQ